MKQQIKDFSCNMLKQIRCFLILSVMSMFFSAEGMGIQVHPILNDCLPKEKEDHVPQTMIEKAGFSATVLPAGKKFRITYNWNASPMAEDYQIWVDIKDESGKTVFKDDHTPPFPTRTSTWSGVFNYTRLVMVPSGLKEGTYTIVAGLLNKETGHRPELTPGKGVTGVGNCSYQIGAFTVDNRAPMPPLDSSKPATLNLDGYRISFSDEFDGPLDVSPLGGHTKWIAHTPYGGDFGDSEFADPEEGFPFSISNGILTIQAKKDSTGKWRSGLLCSVDTKGNGFAQQYGYFEMRAKFPEGPGTWPAFWLLALQKLKDKTKMGFEVDIVEQYGRNPDQLHSVLHWWFPDKTHKSVGNQFTVANMPEDFHTYGFLWDEKNMIWYFDGVELWRQPTPPESKTPMYVLLNLALGPGWPIDKTPNPSSMLVDYLRVYTKCDNSPGITQTEDRPVINSSLLPGEIIPDGWGVQLKLHSNSSEDLDRIRELGLTWVRHGFHWASIEKEKGIYDFEYYDRVVKECHARGLKMVGCIGLNNEKVYGVHAKDEPARSAYGQFAAALAARYKDYDIVWEIWNEPNVMTFWGKHGGIGNSERYAAEYLDLVKATVPAMKKANPDCIILGGSVSNMWTESYKWMNFIFRMGILKTGIEVWSVHPYGVKSPEDYVEAYDTTRRMMSEAGGPVLPLMNSERGFPLGKHEGYAGGNEKLSYEYQAWHIVRQYLIDRYLDVHGTIWYEWIDQDKKEGFSLYREGEPLPAFTATRVLIRQLKGYKLDKRIETGSKRDFVLRFIHPSGAVKLVAWTAPPFMESPDKIVPHPVSVAVEEKGILETTNIYGNKGNIRVQNGKIQLQLSGAPLYVTVKK
ncbi:MAG: family 16 glycosylhydrolase [Mangrovibacterium sp.]